MAMGQDQAADPICVCFQVCEIREDDVDAVHVLVGKSHTAVDDDDIASEFEYGHILADLAEAAKRDDFQF